MQKVDHYFRLNGDRIQMRRILINYAFQVIFFPIAMVYGLHKAETRRKTRALSGLYSFSFCYLAFLACLIANPLGIIYKMATFIKEIRLFNKLNRVYRGDNGYRRRKYFLPLLFLLQIVVNPFILMCYIVP